MAKEKILVVDDENDILTLIRFNLEREGFRITTAESGEAALAAVAESMPDLILLDLMLPGIDGLEVCRKLRQQEKTAHIPVIMLTAKSEETDMVVGLEMGADDYIPKPFSNKVLAARVRSLLRRRSAAASDESTITRGELLINPGRREVSYADIPLELTFTEFELLLLLARRPGWVFSRSQIVNQIKGSDYPVTERAVDVQIVGLRRRLGDAGEFIETVRGVGYRFKG